jgi:hypothetical protein
MGSTYNRRGDYSGACSLWERFYRPVPRKVYAVIVIAALVAAFYLTWAAERQKNIELSQALDTQRLQIVDLKLKKYGKNTTYFLDAWMTNTGPQATSTPIPVKRDPIYTHSELSREVGRIMHQLEDDAKCPTQNRIGCIMLALTS